jgi:DNA-binding GntR family transcriptional regulator
MPMTTMPPETPTGAEEQQPARERVYLYVREQILRGNFPGGSFVEEEQISAAIGVSRTPVREAFHRLQAERFIDLLPRRGARVRQVTAEELVQLYEARLMLEGYVASRICREGIAVPAQMPELLARMREADVRDDLFTHVELNRLFHRAMVAALGNDVLIQLYDSLSSRQQLVAMTALGTDPGRLDVIMAEHAELIEALQAKEEGRARNVLDRHLQPVFTIVSRLRGFSGG